MNRERTPTENVVLSCLSDARRRRTLDLLLDRTSPIELRELATNLTAVERDQALVEVTLAAVKAVRTDLLHVHLPRLEDAGLVTWDRSLATVTTTDHPALDDPTFQRMIAEDAQGWGAVVDNLAHHRRRVVLAALEDADGAVPRTDLAERVLVRERDGAADQREGAGDLLIELHHLHLPALQQAGLVDYDADRETVAYVGHPALDEEWLDARPDETPRAIVPAACRPDDVWTIEGRDNVVARGQSLFDQADEELFLMFTTDGLLEDGCVRRMQEAVDRGVDVYVGSQTPEVRDLVRERVPEATIWEPQMDWLNLPPDHERVGRLVMADREAIMLASLGEETGDGVHHEETAITGADENNPLVVLLRELLGTRLDHLDAQSEDVLEQLPL